MDRAEAIKILVRSRPAFDIGKNTVFTDAYDVAIAALREQEQSNEPLTLEELRQMDGEPVYCAEYDEWGIVNVEVVGYWADKPFLGRYSRGVFYNYDIEMRGLTLYRHKPKEGAEG